MQIPGILARRRLVVSGGASATARIGLASIAATAAALTNWRRVGVVITISAPVAPPANRRREHTILG